MEDLFLIKVGSNYHGFERSDDHSCSNKKKLLLIKLFIELFDTVESKRLQSVFRAFFYIILSITTIGYRVVVTTIKKN